MFHQELHPSPSPIGLSRHSDLAQRYQNPSLLSWHQFVIFQPPCSFYLDLDWLGQYWNCWEGKGRIYHHTGPVNTMYGLREGLAMVAEEGLENCWRRHRLAADTLQAGLADLGLEMFVPDPKARYVRPSPFFSF